MRHGLPSVLGAVVLLILGMGAAAVWGKQSKNDKDAGRRAGPERVEQAAPAASPGGADLAESVRTQAVRWTTGQVGSDVVVACDPVLCGALTAAGRPAAATVTVRAAGGDLLQADVALVSAVIRGRYGRNLDAITAPGVLAGFGQGDARIEVRAVAPDGAADRRRRLVADTAERRVAGRELAGGDRLELTPQARPMLASGLVDARLMDVLTSLSDDHRLRVAAFADGGAPRSAVPCRTVLIDAVDGAAPAATDPRTAAVLRFLRAQDPPYRPLSADVIRPPDLRRPVIRIRYTAPSPLGLLAPPVWQTNQLGEMLMATTSDWPNRTRRLIARASAAFAALALGGGSLCAGAGPALAAPTDGYVRLAHLSPDTPAVDVYLYSFGKKTPRLVLKHVGYGALSPYQRLGTGTYTVAMRPADAAASSPPVLSTNVRVRPGAAYTVAGMGPYKGIKLQILDDTLSVPANSAALRVVVASLKQPTVDVTLGATRAGRQFASDLRFPAVTPYQTVNAKYSAVGVTGESGKTAYWRGQLPAGSIHTCVVLDGKSGLRVLHLRDAAQGSVPLRGVDTGLGGLAPGGQGSGVPWQFITLIAVAGLAGLTLIGAVRVRRA